MEFETRAIHAGQDPEATTGAVTVPIYATSTYAQAAPGKHAGYEYSRTDNPTRHALAEAITSLEGGAGTIITASGMAATSLIGWSLKPGDHVILPDDAYGGTYRFFAKVLSRHGVEFTAADLTDTDGLKKAIRPNTEIVWTETPTNPLLRISDIAALSEVTHEAGAALVVDNTFATPYLQQPIALGADLVIHSTTKYMGGHSDVVGGAIVAADVDVLDGLRFLENATGPIAGPFDAYLVLRGVKTLGVRMDRHSFNALMVARFLEADDRVERVIYPGLASHPHHGLAARQMKNFGGMVSFIPKGGPEKAAAVTMNTELFFLAESLGGVESLIEVPASMTHMSVVGTALEVPDDLVRLSVGIEHVDDLISDLDRALGAT
ncbi:MAG: cystathionine gamma-synthase [Acidimicrobiia bacterium]|nr:cystathionine gamma-synthase [Acidimicrobiia bacterium]MDH5504036.1 cystathionine gamma-synthase [Acidimicrobiia bacterium]